MESKPAQVYGEAPSDPPATIRLASPDRILQAASMIASVPVLQADEFEVTWFPNPSKPAIFALMPLLITRSTTWDPRRRTFPALTAGTTVVAMVSIPQMPHPKMVPEFQSAGSSSLGISNPASLHSSMAAMAAYPMLSLWDDDGSPPKHADRFSSNFSGTPPIRQENFSSSSCGMYLIPDFPLRIACSNSSRPVAFGLTTPMPVITTRFCFIS